MTETTKEPKQVPWNDDLLNRGEEATNLVALVDRKVSQNKNYRASICINGAWGNGKTFFLTGFAQQLKQSKNVVIRFNCWEADLSGNPLTALFVELHDQFKEQIPAQANLEGMFQDLLNSLPVFYEKILNTVILASGGVWARIFNFLAKQGPLSNQAAQEEFRQKARNEYVSFRDSVKQFKKGFEAIRSALFQIEGKRPPIYLLIDELDRCNPPYAIKVLEAINYLLNVDGLVVIVAANINELSAVVKGQYGQDYDGQRYLQRFFDHIHHLEQPGFNQMIEALIMKEEVRDDLNFVSGLEEFYNLFLTQPYASSGVGNQFFKEWCKCCLPVYLDEFDFSIRDVEQIFQSLVTIINNKNSFKDKQPVHLHWLIWCLIAERKNLPIDSFNEKRFGFMSTVNAQDISFNTILKSYHASTGFLNQGYPPPMPIDKQARAARPSVVTESDGFAHLLHTESEQHVDFRIKDPLGIRATWSNYPQLVKKLGFNYVLISKEEQEKQRVWHYIN